jgi:hypothetical protein
MSFQEEYHLQVSVMTWIKIQYPNILVTIAPSGVKLSIGVAMKMKRMGYSLGTPDIMIFEARKGKHGLFIELKTRTGKVSPEQKEWHQKLKERNYEVEVCWSFEEAICTIENYLK